MVDDRDAEAIRAVLQGDTDRFADLVDAYQAQAVRMAFSFLGDYEEARDVAQDAFVDAYRALRRFRRQSKFSTWLYRIVINGCKDACRRRAHRPLVVASIGEPDVANTDGGLFVVDVDDPAAGPGDQLANRELSNQLSAAIARLPGKQQEAFILHHLHGMALEEVADVMGCRTGTVKSHVFRAMEALRGALRPWMDEEALGDDV